MKKQLMTELGRAFEIVAIEAAHYKEFQQFFRRPIHTKQVWQINYVVSGERDMILDGNKITLHKDEFICIPPAVPRQTLESRMFCDVVCLNFDMTSPNPVEEYVNTVIALEPQERDLLMKITHLAVGTFEYVKENDLTTGMVPHTNTSPYVLHALKLYLELFILILGNRLSGNAEPVNLLVNNFEQYNSKIVSDIKLFFSENLDRVVSIEELSEHFNLSPTTLKTVFKKATGNTLIHFFNGMKIERARALLHATDMTISEISDALGFCSPTHFSTTFKKYIGRSPQQYIAYCKSLLPHLNRKMRNW